jgi:hypothetical protein
VFITNAVSPKHSAHEVKLAVTAQLNSSSYALAIQEFPLVGQKPVAFGICALLLLIGRYLLFGFEFITTVRQIVEGTAFLWGCIPGCCCRCRSRTPRPLGNWIRVIGSTGAYVLERLLRHTRAIRQQWSEWARLRNRIARNQVAVTWQFWQAWSVRLRAHQWHRDRRTTETVGVAALVQSRI